MIAPNYTNNVFYQAVHDTKSKQSNLEKFSGMTPDTYTKCVTFLSDIVVNLKMSNIWFQVSMSECVKFDNITIIRCVFDTQLT